VPSWHWIKPLSTFPWLAMSGFVSVSYITPHVSRRHVKNVGPTRWLAALE
jgi:hypothetical protein